MSATLEHGWELELPASTPEQLLAALTARDRLFGQTITLEPEDEPEKAVEVWLGTTDALADETFHLGVYAELTGPSEFLEAARDALEDIVSEQVEEANAEAAQAELLESRPSSAIHFEPVKEEDERPQLIVPEWLAPGDPEEIELPWGFRPFDSDGKAWPANATIEAHDRLVLVPFGDELRLYTLPAIEDEEEE